MTSSANSKLTQKRCQNYLRQFASSAGIHVHRIASPDRLGAFSETSLIFRNSSRASAMSGYIIRNFSFGRDAVVRMMGAE